MYRRVFFVAWVALGRLWAVVLGGGHRAERNHGVCGGGLYLYAPAHQQRLLRPLFETITQQVVAAAQEKAALSPNGLLNPRLELFLDEAGNCAALSDLDVLATTARGRASSWSRSGMTGASSKPATAPRPPPS